MTETDGGAIRLGDEGATKTEKSPLDGTGVDRWRVAPAALPDGTTGTVEAPCGEGPSFFPQPDPWRTRQKARKRTAAPLFPRSLAIDRATLRTPLSRT